MVSYNEIAIHWLLKAFFTMVLFFLVVSSWAQSFKVCTYTDSKKNEKGCGNRFVLQADTLTLNLIVDLEEKKASTDTVIYVFYKQNEEGLEEFLSEVPLKISKSSTYFYMPADFYSAGSYYVKVRKKKETILAEGGFTIIFSEDQDKKQVPGK